MTNPKPKRSHVLRVPAEPDLELPLFVYGALKPGEIGWSSIAQQVSSWDATVAQGVSLSVSDGVAFASFENQKKVTGAIVRFKDPSSAFAHVHKYEGLRHDKPRYKWGRIATDHGPANILLRNAKRPLGGQVESWSSSDDEVFRHSMPWIRQEISEALIQLAEHTFSDPKKSAYWHAYFRLQAAVLLLWSVQERLEMFLLGVTDVGTNLSDRRRAMASTREYQDAMASVDTNSNLLIKDYRAPDGHALEATTNAIEAWYRLRSNITHHGKGSEKEAELVAIAAVDHFNVLLAYFKNCHPGIAARWDDLTTLSRDLYSSRLY